MNRKEALQATNDVDFFGINDKHKEELSKALINKIYDDLENQTCDNCKHFKTPQYGHSVCAKIGNTTVPKDFGCNRWESS